MTYRLAAGALEVRTTIENISNQSMPISIGYHCWYQIPDSSRDSWKVHLPVREHYSLSDKLIPTGATTPVQLEDPTPLRGRQLDDVFGGVDSKSEFWVEGNGRRISVRFGPKYPVAVVFAPQAKNIICFEPMTGITNAFNLAHAGVYQGLQAIPAGEKWEESFWIRPSGF
jgi:aldose 1-epimerase